MQPFEHGPRFQSGKELVPATPAGAIVIRRLVREELQNVLHEQSLIVQIRRLHFRAETRRIDDRLVHGISCVYHGRKIFVDVSQGFFLSKERRE